MFKLVRKTEGQLKRRKNAGEEVGNKPQSQRGGASSPDSAEDQNEGPPGGSCDDIRDPHGK
jgi:hypothetical protein